MAALGSVGEVVPAARASSKPNLIFILTDDQRIGTMGVVPSAKQNFPISLDGFVTTPLCCPSRSSFLTGEYAHNTHVATNFDFPVFQARDAESIGPWLRQQGYYTGFFGKYFNHYFSTYPTPPGWDEFRAIVWLRPKVGDHYTHWTMREHFFDGSTTHDKLVAYPNRQFPNAYDASDRDLRGAFHPARRQSPLQPHRQALGAVRVDGRPKRADARATLRERAAVAMA